MKRTEGSAKGRDIVVRAPGKLYISGEYGILTPGNPAVLVALDRYVTVRLSPVRTCRRTSTDAGTGATVSRSDRDDANGQGGAISSDLYPGVRCLWTRDASGSLRSQEVGPSFGFAFRAIRVADDYARAEGCEPLSFDIRIASQLDATDGRKYGLGSSAAVSVACVRAVLRAYRLEDRPLLVFKLASLAHLSAQGNGSLGDVAASVMGGWVYYRSFDRQWVRSRITQGTDGVGGDTDTGRLEGAELLALLRSPWPDLELRRLTVDPHVCLLVGWTGQPAFTGDLVAGVARASSRRDSQTARRGAEAGKGTAAGAQDRSGRAVRGTHVGDTGGFAAACAQVVDFVALGLETGDFTLLSAAIARNRSLLGDLQRMASVPIEIPSLTRGIDLANGAGAAAKSSGAGNGDCLIALVRLPSASSSAPERVDGREGQDDAVVHRIHELWRQGGVTPLDVRPTPAQGDQDSHGIPGGVRGVESARERRKDEHLRLAQRFGDERRTTDFARMHLLRPTLPETALSQVGLEVGFFGHRVSAPLLIDAMTGGTKRGTDINCALARVAARENIPLAFGSASLVAGDPSALEGFTRARELAGPAPVLVNVNPLTPPDTVSDLVRRLSPAAVQIHVNAVQETVMAEGDRDFRWLERIRTLRELLSGLHVPVILKEVGFGFDPASLRKAADAGIAWVDVAGSGGTDFVRIENARNGHDDWSMLEGCGLSTVRSLLAARMLRNRSTRNGASRVGEMRLIGSGGVRTPLDALKCLALGAEYVGVSGAFLHTLLSEATLREGEMALARQIGGWKEQLRQLLCLYGIRRPEDASGLPVWYDGQILSWMDQMGHMLAR